MAGTAVEVAPRIEVAPGVELDGLEGLSDERLEAELLGLAARDAATRCRLILLVAELDRRGVWRAWGTATCAAWLSWKIGLDARTGREWLRIGHALRGLPAVTRTFALGRISYSKVRALTRIATPATEQTLLGWACHAPAAQIEQIARAYARVDATIEARTLEALARQSLSWRRTEHGTTVFRVEVPDADADVAIAVLRTMVARLETDDADGEAATADHDNDGAVDDGPAGPGQSGSAPADVPEPAAARGPVDDPVDVGSAGPEPRGGASATVETPAPGDDCVDDPVDVGSAGPGPAPSAPAEDSDRPPGADSSDVSLPVSEDDLIDDSGMLPGDAAARRHARHLARAFVALAEVAAGTGALPGARAAEVVVHVDLDTLQGRVPARRVCELAGGRPIDVATAQALACDGALVRMLTVDGVPIDHGRKIRAVPPSTRRAVLTRDGYRCRFPGCRRRRGVQVHHVDDWGHGGPTDTDRLVALCWFHHHIVIHRLGFRIDILGPGGRFRFRQPDGTHIPPHRPLPDLDLHAAIDTAALGELDSRGLIPYWDRHPWRLDWAIEALLIHEGRWDPDWHPTPGDQGDDAQPEPAATLAPA